MTPMRTPSVAVLSSLCRSSQKSAFLPTSRSLLPHQPSRNFTSTLSSGIRTRATASSRRGGHECWVRTCKPRQSRLLTTSSALAADPTKSEPAQGLPLQGEPSQSQPGSGFSQLSSLSRSIGLDTSPRDKGARRTLEDYGAAYQQQGEHHIYVYAHKHNTHITLTGPQYHDPKTNRMRQDIILTLSCGNIGYRKSQRSTFDAAYQLGSYFMSRMQNDGLLMKIQRLELVLRGFGNGREACSKLMLGQEGTALRDRIVRVVDASRLKFGGQRAPRPRRLG
jgi:small subunit ribosomal protein S11